MFAFTLALAAYNIILVHAFHPWQLGSVKKPSRVSSAFVPAKTGFFDQLLDHSNPKLGTFKQRFFFDDVLWTGDGAPIVITSPGEQAADGFDNWLTDPYSLPWPIMQTLGAAGVVLEHRYWGQSSPYQNLTTENMKYLTIDQAIEDTKYFVETVKLPWTKKNTKGSHPAVTPWVNLGCSYPGTMSAYSQEKYPDTFAAAWASSAPVEAQTDYWQYFEPIIEGMSKNCSSDVALAIKTIDETLTTGNASAKAALKKSFGLDGLTDDDFAGTLVYPLYTWQSLSSQAAPNNYFQVFCNSIETFPNGTTNHFEQGVGAELAVANFANYIKKNWYCDDGTTDGSCWTTYDYSEAMYTDLTVGNYADRQWYWMICNEFGWFQDGDPGNYSSIVSAFVNADYTLRQCNHMFPSADGNPGNFSPDTAGNNAVYKGFNLRADHLFVVNGQFDPWRSASLSSNWAPPFENTDLQGIEVVAGGHHCWDWDVDGSKTYPDVKRVVALGAAKVKGWVTDWYTAHPKVKNNMPPGGLTWEDPN